MIVATPEHDTFLKARLENIEACTPGYWSFKGNSRREHSHVFFQYPAMMVPQLVKAILDEVCLVHPEIENVVDPFSGSGTVLTECMLKGLSFAGNDINPLAILLCRTKAGPFFPDSLKTKTEELLKRIELDDSSIVEVEFPGRDKWFRSDVQINLSKIKRSIASEKSLWARRFFWIAFAGTIRLCSNSRTSTYKLHIRPNDDVINRKINPAEIFGRVLSRNLGEYVAQTEYLNTKGLLQRGRFANDIQLTLGDTKSSWNNSKLSCDIVITSPPYGDNATTVPYGQYSYLPLQWIDLDDIDKSVDVSYLRTTHEIDRRSLGGHKKVTEEDNYELFKRSYSLKQYIEQLKGEPTDRASRVVAFFRDLDTCVEPIVDTLRPGGLVVWILGNRMVGGKSVPFDKILNELLFDYNIALLTTLKRQIPSKRMAIKNSVADTMMAETILVMRKAVK